MQSKTGSSAEGVVGTGALTFGELCDQLGAVGDPGPFGARDRTSPHRMTPNPTG